jgi:UDP-GlcNAc3NAcA epimerase
MRILSIVGARPQFVKMAVVCHWLRREAAGASIEHRIVHTGQHYDPNMSEVFFSELGIPAPDSHLGVGSGSHGAQTGEMIKRLETVVMDQRPDYVLLYGDTNSTLAGAVVCAKLGVPSAHVEAGLRSFNRGMPEEINRVAADHLCDILFCPTPEAVRNLEKEGLGSRSVLCGDIMYDAALHYRQLAETRSGDLSRRFAPREFVLATIHRAENTDDPEKLREIVAALESIAADVCPVVLPLHPRTRKCLDAAGIELRGVTVLPPVSYLDMLLLESRARFIVTDSGGVQKEAYFVELPCITAREETEWVETLENGCNILAGAHSDRILAAAARASQAGPWLKPYGDGNACGLMLSMLNKELFASGPSSVIADMGGAAVPCHV